MYKKLTTMSTLFIILKCNPKKLIGGQFPIFDISVSYFIRLFLNQLYEHDRYVSNSRNKSILVNV